MELSDILKVLPEAVAATFTRENFERLEEMQTHIRACIELTLDIMREPLEAFGEELPKSRGIEKEELRPKVEAEIKKRLAILPYQ